MLLRLNNKHLNCTCSRNSNGKITSSRDLKRVMIRHMQILRLRSNKVIGHQGCTDLVIRTVCV